MEALFKVSIPKPCYEDWDTMKPNENGRFCAVCAKSVVDFTGMDTHVMQQFISQNQEQKICGRFKHEQVTSNFKISISESFLYQHRSFRKSFLLALFVVMGTTLFSCKNEKGEALQEINIENDAKVTMGAPIFRENLQEDSEKYEKESMVKTVRVISVSESSPVIEPLGAVSPPAPLEPSLMGDIAIVPVEIVNDSIPIVKDSIKSND